MTNSMSDDRPKADEIVRRRTVLKSLLTGVGAVTGTQVLPEKWTRPAISSVVLPVHAIGTNPIPNCIIDGFGAFPTLEGSNEVDLEVEVANLPSDVNSEFEVILRSDAIAGGVQDLGVGEISSGTFNFTGVDGTVETEAGAEINTSEFEVEVNVGESELLYTCEAEATAEPAG